eukprot:GHVN01066496.1.p2 GENE.GHVN01066496.1~~GHVN01066496.1.p2  ORF type:complete len:219 (+),score=33.97 GHVN01066496.1:1873-2529(+)
MGSAKSKGKQKEATDEEIGDFVRKADHEQLSAAIHSKSHDDGRMISKKETIKVIEIQITQMNELIGDLELQIRKDELAARRFVALKRNELAGLALKKKVYHVTMIQDLAKCVEKHDHLLKQINQNKLDSSVSKALLKASKTIRDVKDEIAADYIRLCRRPDFTLVEMNDHLVSLGRFGKDHQEKFIVSFVTSRNHRRQNYWRTQRLVDDGFGRGARRG